MSAPTLPPCRECAGSAIVSDGSSEPFALCGCGDGVDHDSIPAIRAAHAKAVPGPWTAALDHCDCGDGYGCDHGSWVHAIHLPDQPSWLPPEGVSLDDSVVSWRSRCEHSELATMPLDTAEFIASSWRYVQVLLARIDELEGGAS